MEKLKAMQCFCRAVEAGSFAGAAQLLDVVPSAVSKAVAGLEQELGFMLVNRSTRGFSPTEAGRTYYEQCRHILEQIEQAEAEGRQGRTNAVGTLRVGMHPALRALLLTHLGPFLDAHPGVMIETVTTNSPNAVVHEGLDVLLHIGHLPDSALRARRIGSTRSVLCAAPAYLASHPAPRHPRELAGHRAVIYARRDEASNARWLFLSASQRCEVEVSARTVSRDGIGVVDAILGGCGVGRPFEVSVRHWLRVGRLQELLAEWTSDVHPVTAVLAPVGQSVSGKVRLYLEHVERLLQQE